MSEPLPLVLEALGHTYGTQTRVLEGVDLRVQPGELVAVLGASGSGKTTLLRSVAGFVTPTEGTIRIHGDAVAEGGVEKISAEKRRVGMVFQDYALFPHMSVRANIAFGLHGQSRDAQRSRVDALLALIGLSELGDRRPSQLSGGQQQRVALARALAPKPRLLLLDEPFANLDAALRQGLGDSVAGILAREQVSGLLVTHDRTEALGLADRVAILGVLEGQSTGRLLQCDTPEAVYHRPHSAQVARLTGAAIMVPGTADGDTAQTELGPLALAKEAKGAVEVLLRPEQLQFDASEGGPVAVISRRFQGARYHLRLSTPVGELTIEHRGVAPEPGAAGRLVVDGAGWAVSTSL